MKIKFLLCALLFFSARLSAQNADEDALKNLIRLENESIIKRDTATFKSLYVHDDKMRRDYISSNGIFKITGWNNFDTAITQWVKTSPPVSRYTDVKDDNYLIRMGDNIATVEFDQIISAPGTDSLKPSYTHEMRTMIKRDNQWKIATFITIDSLSFTSGDSAYIENNLNGIGYQLLNAKKIKDAIEVFKVNVKLFPNSWNVYDSLGEAYADDGNTDEAIKNYEMSVKINPKNDNGKRALEKLRKMK